MRSWVFQRPSVCPWWDVRCGFVFLMTVSLFQMTNRECESIKNLSTLWWHFEILLRKQYEMCVCECFGTTCYRNFTTADTIHTTAATTATTTTPSCSSQNPLFMFSHQSLKSVSSLIWFSFVILRYSRKCELNALSTSWIYIHSIHRQAQHSTHTHT